MFATSRSSGQPWRNGVTRAATAAVVALALAAPAAAQMGPSKKVRYVPGVVNSEDVVGLAGTPWLIAGGVKGPGVPAGRIFAVDTATGAAETLYPAPRAREAQDRTLFGACPGKPDKAKFDAHGMNARPLGNGKYALYATNNGDRSSIEVFEIDVTGKRLGLTWIGCVIVPSMTSARELTFANSVAPLPDGAIAATLHAVDADMSQIRKTYEIPQLGKVAIWRPGQGWTDVPGSQVLGANGIEASADGKWLYVTADQEPGVFRISLGATPVEQVVIKTPFQPDNIRWGDDGKLYVAGIRSNRQQILDCVFSAGDTCTNPYVVIRADPETLHVEYLADEPGDANFGLATGLAKVGDEVWVSSYRGVRLAVFPLK